MSSHADRWVAERMRHIESSGIRKVFELARSLDDPVNLSIGQPDFDVPGPVKAAVHARYRDADREVFITSGTSGGLVLALCCTVNPGDEVIVLDPYFVSYP